PVRGGVIVSNFGPGGSYDTGMGWNEIGPTSPSNPSRQAFPFTVGGMTDFRFDGARLALSLSGGTNAIPALRLYSDVGGNPGGLLESIPVPGTLGPFNSNTPPVVFTPPPHPLPQPRQTYWLLPFASGDTEAVWVVNNRGLSGPRAVSNFPDP